MPVSESFEAPLHPQAFSERLAAAVQGAVSSVLHQVCEESCLLCDFVKLSALFGTLVEFSVDLSTSSTRMRRGGSCLRDIL